MASPTAAEIKKIHDEIHHPTMRPRLTRAGKTIHRFYQELLHEKNDSPPPVGCRSPEIRRLLKDFLAPKRGYTLKTYWLKYQCYARFLGIDPGTWAGALETLLLMKGEDARTHLSQYRIWLKARHKSYSGISGSDGPGMMSLMRFAYARKIVSWKYPDVREMLIDKAWENIDPAFKSAALEWARSMRVRGCTPGSIERNMTAVRTIGRWLSKRKTNYLDLDYDIAMEWMEWLLSQVHWEETYRRSKYTCAKLFYRWLRARRLVLENPFDVMGRMRVTTKLPSVLSEREMLRVISAAQDERERAIVEYLYATGCRASEVCSSNQKELSLGSRTIKVLGKPRRERILLFNGATVKALRAYLPIRRKILAQNFKTSEPALFVSIYGDRLGWCPESCGDSRQRRILLRSKVLFHKPAVSAASFWRDTPWPSLRRCCLTFQRFSVRISSRRGSGESSGNLSR